MSDSLFWKNKDIIEYQRKLESELPPFYDFEQVRSVHQEIEATILEYWENLHPLVQDFLTSWWQLWTNEKKAITKLNVEIDQRSSMLSNYKNNAETLIKNLLNKLNIRESELNIIKQNLQQKEQQIQELEAKDKENRLDIGGLRIDFEQKLAELNLKISEMQNRFEITQNQVIRSFENKVMIFESEIASLMEQIASQEQKIQNFHSENLKLQNANENLKIIEEKLIEIVNILTGLSFKETEN